MLLCFVFVFLKEMVANTRKLSTWIPARDKDLTPDDIGCARDDYYCEVCATQRDVRMVHLSKMYTNKKKNMFSASHHSLYRNSRSKITFEVDMFF